MVFLSSIAPACTLVQHSNFSGRDPCKFICVSLKNSLYSFFYYSGGKAGATTIDNDHQFSVALAALLKKNTTTCQAGVEFDLNDMDGFRIRNRVCSCIIL